MATNRYIILGPLHDEDATGMDLLLARRKRIAAAIESLSNEVIAINESIDKAVQRAKGVPQQAADASEKLDELLARRARRVAAIEALSNKLVAVNEHVADVVQRATGIIVLDDHREKRPRVGP